MSDLNLINNFIRQKKIILYGASRTGKIFSQVSSLDLEYSWQISQSLCCLKINVKTLYL